MPAAHFVWRQRSKWDKMFPWKEKYFSYRDGIYIPIQSRFLTNVIRLCLLSRGSGRQQSPATDTLLILFSFIGSNLCFLFSASTSTCFQQFPLCLSWPWTHSARQDVCILYLHRTLLFLSISWCFLVCWDGMMLLNILHQVRGSLDGMGLLGL